MTVNGADPVVVCGLFSKGASKMGYFLNRQKTYFFPFSCFLILNKLKKLEELLNLNMIISSNSL